MDIISRNFFRLLRSGTFCEEEQIEPMSAWKWRRTYQYALMHGVSALLFDGIENCRDQFFLQLPDNLMEAWKESVKDTETGNKKEMTALAELYPQINRLQVRPILAKGQSLAILYEHPEHRQAQGIDVFFPFQTKGEKADKWAMQYGINPNTSEKTIFSYEWNQTVVKHHHRLILLTNNLLNHSLQNIIEKEFRESEPNFVNIAGTRYETTSNTLTVLHILIYIAKHLLNYGVPLKQLVDLGIVLRKTGDKVDFVKLQNWIDKLRLHRIAHLAGMMLVTLFHFTEDEIPFIIPNHAPDLTRIMNEMFTLKNTNQGDWYFQQGKDIFVHATNSSAMIGQIQRSTHYFRFYPSESVTNFFSSFVHSLSHIEE